MKMLKAKKEKIRSLDIKIKKKDDNEIHVWMPAGRLYRFIFGGKGICCVYGCPRPTIEENLLCFNCLGEAKKKGNEKELIKAARIASLARKIKKKI